MLKEDRVKFLQDIQLELSQIHQSGFSLRNKFLEIRRILDRLAKELLEEEALQFPSLFSRIVFIAQKYKVPQSIERNLHQVRVVSNFLLKEENRLASERQYDEAYHTLFAFQSFLIDGKEEELIYDEKALLVEKQSLAKIRVQVIDIVDVENVVVCCPHDSTEYVISVRFGVEKINVNFSSTFAKLWIGAQLNLIDCKIDQEGFYVPSMIVLEPDYLIDASAIAECFQNYGNSPLHYFRRKFETVGNTHYLLLGNLANFFLDELVYAKHPQSIKFEDVFKKSFQEMPFEFTACKDIQSPIAFRDFMSRANRQFVNIKRVVSEDMPATGFSLDQCVLEPSFYSETFGFQGRLDMLQTTASDSFTRIVELKSGKPPWPQDDTTKIAPNHESQTSVYRLMIQSVLDKKARDIYAMILYSSADFKRQNLRLSAPYKQLEKEIVNLRNEIVALEHQLYMGDGHTVEEVFDLLFDSESYSNRVPEFFEARLEEMRKTLSQCSEIEKTYFYRFISFVTRELYLLKMGDEGYDSSMSLSALWNTSFQERKNALELVDDLEIENITEHTRDMQICFKRKASTDFVNFREGEICIVYPRQSEEDTILSNQVLKGTVIEISATHVLVRFRYKQRHRAYFDENRCWVLEHDKLDHGYNAMYKGLYAFMQAPKRKKDLLLGLEAPCSDFTPKPTPASTNEEKREEVIQKALSAEDYFLIVGPPGTGKTSIFAKELIQRLCEQPDTDILVVAYTNRAVDELCEAICDAFGEESTSCEKYIRIGSEYSCDQSFRHRLLQNISEVSTSRKALLEMLQGARVYVGTLASVIGKPELFEIKQFDVAIIDEASQILEPQIVGLLPLFQKFIMIGDHKQLSTITLQSPLKSKIDDEVLNKIGLYDCRESIFERLFRTAQQNNWTFAYDTLDYHGRMHEDIATLVNKDFYENKLLIATKRQAERLDFTTPDNSSDLEKIISSQRVAFWDVSNSLDENSFSDKINQAEAKMVVDLAVALWRVYQVNNKPFDAKTTLGIIAPYRNQIALIKHLLEETGNADLKDVMVDTVERYQGSQRDIIIVSFCFNRMYQMRYFSNMNREGTVDRKLNVALTRAREQLFLIGNENILTRNELYRNMLEKITVI